MKIILATIVALLAACSKLPDRGPHTFIQTAITNIPLYNSGWMIQGFGGGGSPEGSSYTFNLQLKGASKDQALTDFNRLLHEQLKKAGYFIISEGGGPSTPYTICITGRSHYFTGSLSVTFTQSEPDLFVGTAVTAALSNN